MSFHVLIALQRNSIIMNLVLFLGACNPTMDLTSFAELTFADVEGSKKESGCENITEAYKFFAEPGYLHEVKGKIYYCSFH